MATNVTFNGNIYTAPYTIPVVLHPVHGFIYDQSSWGWKSRLVNVITYSGPAPSPLFVTATNSSNTSSIGGKNG